MKTPAFCPRRAPGSGAVTVALVLFIGAGPAWAATQPLPPPSSVPSAPQAPSLPELGGAAGMRGPADGSTATAPGAANSSGAGQGQGADASPPGWPGQPGDPPNGVAPGSPVAALPGAAEPGGSARELPDGTVRGSDHDAVVGAWGITVSPSVSQLGAFSRRPSTGCPSTLAAGASTLSTTDCPPVDIRAVGTRHWLTPTLGIDVALALGLGGGSDHGRLLDTYLGVGPLLGASVLLAGWKHLAMMASPAASLVVFRAASSAGTAFVLDLRADLEAELHFGFWGLPALSLGLRSGLDLHLEHGVDVTVWSLGAAGVTSLSRLVSDVSLRYYL